MGWKTKGSILGREQILIFPLLINIQNNSWVSHSHVINGYSGSIPLGQVAEVWTWTVTSV